MGAELKEKAEHNFLLRASRQNWFVPSPMEMLLYRDMCGLFNTRCGPTVRKSRYNAGTLQIKINEHGLRMLDDQEYRLPFSPLGYCDEEVALLMA